MGENAPLPSKIASDFRRQRSGPPKIHRIFGGPGSLRFQRNRRKQGFPPILKEWEETLLCRRKSQAIFDGRGRKEKSWICSFALRAIRQIRDRSENRMRFSERSSIFLFPEGKIFDFSFPGKKKIPEKILRDGDPEVE